MVHKASKNKKKKRSQEKQKRKVTIFILLVMFLAIILLSFNELRYNFLYYVFGQCYIENYHIKGSSNKTVSLKLDIYITESAEDKTNITDYEIYKIMSDVNKTWSEYGVNLEINNLSRFNLTDDSFILTDNYFILESSIEDNFKNLALSVANGHLYKDEDKIIDVVLIPKFKSRFLSFIIDSNLQGIGIDSFPDNRSRRIGLIVVASSLPNETWVITHEFGHILGSYDYQPYEGQFNLMTETGCIKDIYYPTILNQNQVDSAIRTAKTFTESG